MELGDNHNSRLIPIRVCLRDYSGWEDKVMNIKWSLVWTTVVAAIIIGVTSWLVKRYITKEMEFTPPHEPR